MMVDDQRIACLSGKSFGGSSNERKRRYLRLPPQYCHNLGIVTILKPMMNTIILRILIKELPVSGMMNPIFSPDLSLLDFLTRQAFSGDLSDAYMQLRILSTVFSGVVWNITF